MIDATFRASVDRLPPKTEYSMVPSIGELSVYCTCMVGESSCVPPRHLGVALNGPDG